MPNLERLIGFAREQRIPIIWTQSLSSETKCNTPADLISAG
jgi:hypothetical protein